jgi:bis(5'-nucleosidyl)-tetraphosphatase
MIREKSSGVIVFRKFDSEIKYLLLHYESGHWEFTKGHIEKGEDEKETAIRETEEETNLNDLKFVPDFKKNIRYFFKKDGETVMKDVDFFLAESREGEVKLSHEHIGFKWLNFKESIEQLTFDNSKDILKKANEFLVNREKSSLSKFLK